MHQTSFEICIANGYTKKQCEGEMVSTIEYVLKGRTAELEVLKALLESKEELKQIDPARLSEADSVRYGNLQKACDEIRLIQTEFSDRLEAAHARFRETFKKQ